MVIMYNENQMQNLWMNLNDYLLKLLTNHEMHQTNSKVWFEFQFQDCILISSKSSYDLKHILYFVYLWNVISKFLIY